MDILYYGEREKEFYFSDYARSQNLSVETNRVVTFSIESEISTILSAEPKELILDADCIIDDGVCGEQIRAELEPVYTYRHTGVYTPQERRRLRHTAALQRDTVAVGQHFHFRILRVYVHDTHIQCCQYIQRREIAADMTSFGFIYDL